MVSHRSGRTETHTLIMIEQKLIQSSWYLMRHNTNSTPIYSLWPCVRWYVAMEKKKIHVLTKFAGQRGLLWRKRAGGVCTLLFCWERAEMNSWSLSVTTLPYFKDFPPASHVRQHHYISPTIQTSEHPACPPPVLPESPPHKGTAQRCGSMKHGGDQRKTYSGGSVYMG